MIKKVTSRDVARTAGVSQSLVSLILNNVPHKKIRQETREHVLSVAKELNYAVNINARNMKSRRAGAVGLLSSWDEASFVFPPVIKGVQAACSENDSGVIICTGKTDSNGNRDYLNYYLQNRIDAVIYVSYVGVTYDGIISELTENGIPFVCIIGARDIPGVSCADVNFIENGYIAGKHLVDMGYENIAYFTKSTHEMLNYADKERYESCRKAVLEGKKNFTVLSPNLSAINETELISAVEQIISSKKYDAVVACSYDCFIVLKAAARLGIKVPEELGVISLDNDIYAPYLYPSLTTVDEPLYDIAKTAAHIIFDNINGDTSVKKLELTPRLNIRESTGHKQEFYNASIQKEIFRL